MSKYQWPASALDPYEMQLLYREKQRSGKSITLLIREAVLKAYDSHKQ
ncbi:MAG: hypothetical protein H6627_10850 [Calditrichae bacterium]|nr:hypothetical protein [Calditrichia bacterium]